VQSVALRIVCDRELEIEKFVTREYWSLLAHLETKKGAAFTARLVGVDGKKITRLDVGTAKEAEDFKKSLEIATFQVTDVEAKPARRNPAPPFTTSTLQQEASRKLGLSPQRTMQIAQRLYEGVDIGGETVGLITYMRTDGVDMAPEAIAAARKTVAKLYGDEYVPDAPRKYVTKQKNAQEAHEAVRPTDMMRLPKDMAKRLEPDQAKLYELIWTRAIASQMESAVLERTTVDIAGRAGPRALELRASGQVVKFDGFLALYQEGKDDEQDEDGGRLPPMSKGEALKKDKIEATQHFTEPPPRYTEATLIKRMEELGIGRPSTYAATISVLRDREYVELDKKRLVPKDKGRIVTAFLESFFSKYVGYDFTAALEEKLDQIADSQIDFKAVLRDFWEDFNAAIQGTKDLRTTEILDNLNELLGPHIFPAKEDGSDPRLCPTCGQGQLSLKVSRFGAFVGCSNYPECKYTRQLAADAGDAAVGTRVLGQDPETGDDVTLRDGRFGPYIQLGEGEKPKRSSLPKGMKPEDVTIEKALVLLSLPREIAKHPTSGEPILAGIGRFGPYVQHGKVYANIGRDDDILEIGANRAIDLIVAKESGASGQRRFGAPGPGRELGEHPKGGKVTVKDGRYGPYVNWGKINATLPKDADVASYDLAQALALIEAKQNGGGASEAAPTSGKLLGEHPEGGKITVRDGRFGAYVNWGKVNATIPKSMNKDDVTLGEALEWIEAKAGAAPKKSASAKSAGKAGAGKASAGKTVKAKASEDETPKAAKTAKTKTAKAPAKAKATSPAKPAAKAATKAKAPAVKASTKSSKTKAAAKR
jgi:DNA topoisomerase-1